MGGGGIKKSKIVRPTKTEACDLTHDYHESFVVVFVKLCQTVGCAGSWNSALGTCDL